MNRRKIAIAAVVIAVLAFSLYGSYTRLVEIDEIIEGKWSDLAEPLRQRYDLVPKLVEAAGGPLGGENAVLYKVLEARAKLPGAKNQQEQVAAQNELSRALKVFSDLEKKHPGLKADTGYRQLVGQYADIEKQISEKGISYNNTVRAYNQNIRGFPMMVYAGIYGFTEKPLLELNPKASDS